MTSLPMLVFSIVTSTDLLDELSNDLANRTPTFSVLEMSWLVDVPYIIFQALFEFNLMSVLTWYMSCWNEGSLLSFKRLSSTTAACYKLYTQYIMSLYQHWYWCKLSSDIHSLPKIIFSYPWQIFIITIWYYAVNGWL